MDRIAFTFAGRQDRMALQVDFMREALARGLVDHWHIWNFARKPADDLWLRGAFSASRVIRTDPDSIDYIPLFEAHLGPVQLQVRARNDAHILMRMSDGELLEVVFGAFANSRSLLRHFPDGVYRLHHPAAVVAGERLKQTDFDLVSIDSSQRKLQVKLNGVTVFTGPLRSGELQGLAIHTGYGSPGVWKLGPADGKIVLLQNTRTGYAAFQDAYNHYCHADFNDTTFVKLDDDIVYADLGAMGGYLDTVEASPHVELWSANVINNVIAAFYQARNGYFDGLEANFEYPEAGKTGPLWTDAAMCYKLHDYFLKNCDAILDKAKGHGECFEIPAADRYSINFVAFKYPLMLMMAFAYLLENVTDDEHLMTVSLPERFGVKKRIHEPFVVSHLSFYPQEPNLPVAELIERYARLR